MLRRYGFWMTSGDSGTVWSEDADTARLWVAARPDEYVGHIDTLRLLHMQVFLPHDKVISEEEARRLKGASK